jgi:DNA-binding MarR family transcriptional regulator
MTIRFFTKAMISGDPNNSTMSVEVKNVAIHRVASMDVILWIRNFILCLFIVIIRVNCIILTTGCQVEEGCIVKRHENAELFKEIILEIFRLHGLLNTVGDKLTNEFGLSSARWKVLGAIFLAESSQTVPQIAKTMGQSRQAIQKIVTAMNKAGFLTLEENPNHKTAKLISLTQKGKEVFLQLDEKQIVWSNSCSENLNNDKLQSTIEILKEISSDFDCKSL